MDLYRAYIEDLQILTCPSTDFNITHFHFIQCAHAQEALSPQSSLTWTQIAHSTHTQSTGTAANRRFNFLQRRLKKLLPLTKSIGKLQLNLSIRRVSRVCRSSLTGLVPVHRILSCVRELQLKLEPIVTRMTLVWILTQGLNTVYSKMRANLKMKYSELLSLVKLQRKRLTIYSRTLHAITCCIKAQSMPTLRRYCHNFLQISGGTSHLLCKGFLKILSRDFPSFSGDALEQARLVLPWAIFKDRYLYATLMIAKISHRRLMELSSMICLSRTGHELPVSTSSTSRMIRLCQLGMLPQDYGQVSHDSSHPTKLLRMYSTVSELQKSLSQALCYDERNGTGLYRLLYHPRYYLELDAGQYASIPMNP